MTNFPLGLDGHPVYEDIWQFETWDIVQFAAALLSHHRRALMPDQSVILNGLGLSEIEMARAKRIAAKQTARHDDEWLLIAANWLSNNNEDDPRDAQRLFALNSDELIDALRLAFDIVHSRMLKAEWLLAREARR
ncbi:hypothetical protein LUX29_18170 [Aureimonas altamirensis]|uniref:hypothetical protein n=1 Tax=Aureimonas altamirensis TaxID=370622 RepID=UPI001E5C4732|nr:hypothetical protein [Aureimonas altamirensis]UHD44930.1 hypothetical protein LUX29_18170 [Aureimonas altamirensis]